jgi:hypothetical protein
MSSSYEIAKLCLELLFVLVKRHFDYGETPVDQKTEGIIRDENFHSEDKLRHTK